MKRNVFKKLEELKNKKILFFCVGNILKGDDGVGDYIYKKLLEGNNIYKINAANSPLNYIGKIDIISPEVIIIVDCIDSDNSPGTLLFTSLDKVYSIPIDTHSNILKEYMKNKKIL